MRPLKLTMSAFGPYAGETVLDFARLEDENIFVITGPTGAGKTTVFDAICYAFYGETSGSEREVRGLRSDFTPPEDERVTYVELIFQMRQKIYRIRRQPAQKLPMKRGKGFKDGQAAAELACVGHDEFAPLARVNEVDSKIVELLGLTKEQFCKIVMIPQGDFRRFLNADTKEKQGILRKLFGTEMYEQVQELLVQQKTALEKQRSNSLLIVQEKLQHIAAENHEALADMKKQEQPQLSNVLDLLWQAIRDDEAWEQEAQSRQEKLLAEQAQKQQALADGKVNNDRLTQLAKAQSEETALLAQQEAMEAKRQELERIIWAQELQAADQAYSTLAQTVAKQQKQQQDLEQALALGEQKLQQVQDDWERQKALEPQIRKWQAQRQQLESYRMDVQQWQQLEQTLAQSQEQLTLISQQQEKLKADQQRNETLRINTTAQLERLRTEQDNQQQLKHQLELAQPKKQRLEELQEQIQQYGQLQKKWDQLTEQIEKQQTIAELEEQTLHQMRKIQREQYGAALAAGLKEGDPCPVCGALHHPHLQQSEAQLVTEKQLKDQEKQTETLRAQWQKLREQAEGVRAQLAQVENGLAKAEEANLYERSVAGLRQWWQAVHQQLMQLDEKWQQMQKQLAAMQTLEMQITACRDKLQQTEQNAITIQKRLDEIAAQRLEWNGRYQAAQAELRSAASRVPENYRTLAALEQAVKEVTQALEEQQRQQTDAQKRYETCSGEQKERNGQLSTLQKVIDDNKGQLQLAKQAFEQAVARHFANEAEYHHYQALLSSRMEREKVLRTYEEKLAACQSRKCELQELVAGQTAVDIQSLEASLSDLAQTLNAQQKQLTLVSTRRQNNIAIARELAEKQTELDKLAQTYAIVARLSKLASGDNSWRMTFETFVLIAYFNQVLQAANQRLQKMTGGRYSFLRRAEITDKRSKSGLDIDIMDDYTGKARAVSTLSGGEGFKASLALALGLSDVVQQTTGGIELSTIFIDEGFGTLDHDSLDATVDTLVELQLGGRLVGVISHVSELQERIPAQLVVTPSDQGSKAAFVIRR